MNSHNSVHFSFSFSLSGSFAYPQLAKNFLNLEFQNMVKSLPGKKYKLM